MADQDPNLISLWGKCFVAVRDLHMSPTQLNIPLPEHSLHRRENISILSAEGKWSTVQGNHMPFITFMNPLDKTLDENIFRTTCSSVTANYVLKKSLDACLNCNALIGLWLGRS